MSLVLLVYLASIAEDINVVCGLIGGAFVIAHAFATIGHIIITEGEFRFVKWPMFVYIPALLVGTIVPNQKEVYMMMAAGGLESIAQNERVQGIADNSLKLIEKTLGEYLNEETTKKD